METPQVLKTHVTSLEDVLPKSGTYPVALRDAGSLLVEEQPDLVPIYMDGISISVWEAEIKDIEDDDKMKEIAQRKAKQSIDSVRGNINEIVHGMVRYGDLGYPYLIMVSADLDSPNPAMSYPDFRPFSFEIKPKTFELGLTGRLLEDAQGQRFSETLAVSMDIYDAYSFVLDLRPKRVIAVKQDGKGVVVYEHSKMVGKQEARHFPWKATTYLMDDEAFERCVLRPDEKEVLPSGGLRVVHPDFYERIRKYGDVSILFGHKFRNIAEFLSYATSTDDYLIWKICHCNGQDLNSPLVDAGPYYGEYMGNPRHENTNRLHFIPDKAMLWFNGLCIFFDRPEGIQALTSLGDVVRDIWIDASRFRFDKSKFFPQDCGWDIVHDKSRGITPEKPVNVRTDKDYQKYPVLKE